MKRGLPALGPLLLVVLALPAASLAAPPQEHYLLHCSGCHGVDGRGVPGVTPSLHGLAPRLATPDGRASLGRVPGVAQAPLDDAALAALLNWVLFELSSPAAAPKDLAPFRGDELRALRAAPLRDPGASTRAPSLRRADPPVRPGPAPSRAATP